MATYKEAGVDIEKADRFVEYIKNRVKEVWGEKVITPFGGFASGYLLEISRYKNPVLVSTTDGVGTKLKIAQIMGKHDTVGIDLVAMNVNDLVTTLAKPLFFLDYIATGKLDLEVQKQVIDGIVEGCKEAGCYLIGGETAEMPGFYPEGEYDLAGFCVGVVDRNEMPKPENIKPGNLLIGLPSSGIHSNGYSLVRKIIADKGLSYDRYEEYLGGILGEVLLTPTKIYVKDILKLKEEGVEIKGLAHITGGGIPGNLLRILPENVTAVVEKDKLPKSRIFEWIQKIGKVPEGEMFKTFNMGVGMILVTDEENAQKVLSLNRSAKVIGKLVEGKREVNIV
ncbi:MAG TPA: phosphoribosylformylglycinamidine cyclo-ligase [Aquifex aeolicus]|uniref:Phosphoribosylformylglycinamidine cyclo-ligase n=1 Tax=Aquifex aeolicus TaxID=63363 RepID=A0A9D1CFC1_AQUAO|nr:phosphoribosylformylglycinamidine cyclo-ligase [Aquificales bacterium]HIP86052.1 phosphoribosylformylglycinamidine cyclo-ligase [Aquifex sp.]HIP98276.1 phosphoribosylformylglycinamidine cyclo-ligase [Aquifex aeolicus]HIQ26794.1 phosphoribosylformylglycinamidine cyclo-ligase [Aquifex aeolicus]